MKKSKKDSFSHIIQVKTEFVKKNGTRFVLKWRIEIFKLLIRPIHDKISTTLRILRREDI